MLAMCYFAFVYMDSARLVQEQVYQRLWFIFFLVIVPGAFPILLLVLLHLEHPVVKREIIDGQYSALSHCAIAALLELPWILMMATCTLVPASFGIAGFSWTQFWPILLAMFGLLWSLESFAQLVSLLPGLLNAIGQYAGFFSAGFVFTGILLQTKNLIYPLPLIP